MVRIMLYIIFKPSVCLLFGFHVAVAVASEDVSTQSDNAQNVSLYLVNQESGYGFINREGKVVIPGPFSNARWFSEGLAPVSVGDKWGFIDATGQFAIEPRYDNVSSFSEGLAPVCSGDKWGYIDRRGSVVIRPTFARVGAFSEGLALVWNSNPRTDRNSRVGYIDKTGRLLVEPQYSGNSFRARDFSEGMAAVTLPDEWRTGYIDRQGRMVIKPQFTFAEDFSGGLAAVATGHPIRPQWFYIDKTGKPVLVLDSTAARAFSFQEGLASIEYYRKNGGFSVGCIDRQGRVVIAPIFSQIGPFSEGLASARMTPGGKFGYIDQTGKIVIEMKFDRPGLFSCFSNGIARVRVNGQAAYIDKTGEYIWPPALGAVGSHRQPELEQ